MAGVAESDSSDPDLEIGTASSLRFMDQKCLCSEYVDFTGAPTERRGC